ncbi:Cross-pathway control protein 1 [Choanephora cucurbitarum]|uniref:Cross-pathway control protein 1 n=1 Tax=Choanephora cucurbitarum TaxID=101091 RepID=A0A1C7NJR8_9FUNG|nr:Cross-pathway control protein 1 [Choanephora cucurbitarum]
MNPLSNTEPLNFDSLDDWLESDLRQSGILLPTENDKSIQSPMMPPTPAQMMLASPPISECTPRIDPLLDLSTPMLKYEPLSPIETPKAEPQDFSKSNIDLQPFIKALSLLGSLQYQQNSNPQHSSNNNTNSNKRQRSESIEEQQNEVQDLIALKRQRNTDAARRSRQRKAMKMDALEKRVMDLEAENERLRLRAAVAESERANIEAKEKRSRVRVLELERQLADTHKTLLKYNGNDTTLLPATSTIATSAI